MLFATQSNGKNVNFSRLKDNSNRRKLEKYDLRYCKNNVFLLSRNIVTSIKEGEGFTCAMNDEKTKVFLVKVHTNSQVKALFWRNNGKNEVSERVTSAVLAKGIEEVYGNNIPEFFSLSPVSEDLNQGITVYQIIPYVNNQESTPNVMENPENTLETNVVSEPIIASEVSKVYTEEETGTWNKFMGGFQS